MQSKNLTIGQFLDIVKVIRMLYGIDTATAFFEKNFTEFTGLDIKALHKLRRHATITATREN